MTKFGFIFLFLLSISFTGIAQQKLNAKGMSYVLGIKPNNLIFNDSIFRGSNEFKHLFFRTGNTQLIQLYDRHQSNKIAGQIAGLVGVVSMIAGINELSSNKGLGWGLIGGGLVASATGGYFNLCSQKNLLMAVNIFNQQYNRTAIGIGVGNQSAGLVYKF
ncbi:MAG: hypothetical protein Q8K64_04960 [Sediminibacterium sp.]|nr:hypothetical protein [Sediminibacterium sp.]TXT31935.1 MAG: hypothetical protein FD136_1400 [Chitinophagaceae bacterium]